MSINTELLQLENFENVSINAEATTSTGDRASNIFCSGWPSAKIVLESIGLLIKNPIVKILISSIVTAGDALYQKIGCSN